MAFRWLADDDPLIVVLDPLSPHQLKKQKKNVKDGPPLTKLSRSAHDWSSNIYLNCVVTYFAGLIFACTLLGLAAASLREKGKLFLDFIQSVSDTVITVVRWFMW